MRQDELLLVFQAFLRGLYQQGDEGDEELRADLDQFLALMPGTIRLNLHAIYRESETFVDRAKITPEHFKNWIDWAKQNKIGLDLCGEVVRSYLKRTDRSLSKLYVYAKRLRVANVLNNYLEINLE